MIRLLSAIRCLGFACLSLTAASQAVAEATTTTAPLYDFAALTLPGTFRSHATGINEAGQVVGYAFAGNHVEHAVVWHNGVPTQLPSLGGERTNATAINDAGQIVGLAHTPNRVMKPVLWQDGGIVSLTDGADTWGQARGINNLGQVVGYTGHGDAPGWQATLWQDGQSTTLDTRSSNGQVINDASVIGGTLWGNYSRPAAWIGGQSVEIPADFGQIFGINEAGLMTGFVGNDAIVWDGSTLTHLKAARPLSGNEGHAINDLGHVVGHVSGIDFLRAVLWVDGEPVELQSRLADASVAAEWLLFDADGINNKGMIVGTALHRPTDTLVGYVLTPVPEPASVALFIVGLGGVGMATLRRRCQRASDRMAVDG